MKIVCPLLFQMRFLKTLQSSKNYISIFPSFISGLSLVGFLKKVYQIFGKRKTFRCFQIIFEVLLKHNLANFALYRDIEKEHRKLSKIIKTQIKRVSILTDNSIKFAYPLIFQLSCLQTLPTSKNYVSIFPSIISG